MLSGENPLKSATFKKLKRKHSQSGVLTVTMLIALKAAGQNFCSPRGSAVPVGKSDCRTAPPNRH
jgi:hypothetical protein